MPQLSALAINTAIMSESSKKSEKIYYSIGEVAGMFNVNPSLIRFWEKEFDIIKPKKNKKGNRFFTRKDIRNFRLIHHLVKEKGYTLKGAKDSLKANPETLENKAMVVESLEKIKQFLIEMKEGMDE
jgi:DNA-binding transcriptional MerR regulator